jgi:hypothetical protein
MTDQFDRLNAMLRPLPLSTNLFAPNSRYFGLTTAVLDLPDGTQVTYLRRRFVPQPERFSLLELYTVQNGDRLDNLAAQFLGDPEQFWRLCDANRAQRPEALTESAGTQLRITLPEGLQGMGNA